MRIRVERMAGFTLIPTLCENITERTFGTDAGRNVTIRSALSPNFGRRIPHKSLRGIRDWREESAPFLVVPPPGGRHAVLGPEPQPPVHFGFGDPHSFLASVLREHHDVRHAAHLTPDRRRE